MSSPCRPFLKFNKQKWRWDKRRCRWLLKASETRPKGYNCAEYCIAMTMGKAPRWGANSNCVTLNTIEAVLKKKRWRHRNGACNCRTRTGKVNDCIVLYRAPNKTIVHVAILDKKTGVWGGKLNAGMPIARYLRTVDYFEERRVPRGWKVEIYCPTKPLKIKQKSDAWMHYNAEHVP